MPNAAFTVGPGASRSGPRAYGPFSETWTEHQQRVRPGVSSADQSMVVMPGTMDQKFERDPTAPVGIPVEEEA